MDLWVPPSAMAQLVDERRRHEANLFGMFETKGVLDRWNKELKEIDPYLEMVRAKPDAVEGLSGLKPGFFHIMRHNPGAPPTLIPISTPDGEFMEPDSSVFDLMRRSDMWSSQTNRERERNIRKLERAKESRRAREREERRDEFMGRFKALENPGVSFSKTGRPWSYKAGARRAA